MNRAILLCSSKWIIESSQTISIRPSLRRITAALCARIRICCNVLRHCWKASAAAVVQSITIAPSAEPTTKRLADGQTHILRRRDFFVFCLFSFFTTLAALSPEAKEQLTSTRDAMEFLWFPPVPVISCAFFRRFSFRIYISRPVPNNFSALHRLLIVSCLRFCFSFFDHVIIPSF